MVCILLIDRDNEEIITFFELKQKMKDCKTDECKERVEALLTKLQQKNAGSGSKVRRTVGGFATGTLGAAVYHYANKKSERKKKWIK